MQIRGGVMRREEIQRLVSEYFQRNLEDAEDLRADGIGVLKGEDGVYGESGLEGLELHLEGLIEDLARGELRSIARVADAILKEAGVELDKGSHDYRVLSREALKGAVEAIKTELAQRKGDYSDELRPRLTPSPAVPSAPAKPRIKLSEAISEYVKEHNASGNWRKKTKEEAEGIYRLLVGILGDVGVDELDYKKLSAFRDALLRFPSNWTKRPAYRGKTISEVVAMGAAPTPLSATSVNKHLSQTGALLKFCVKRGYAGANYAEGLAITKKNIKPEEQRDTYSTEDLLRLIRSPLYASPEGESKMVKGHPERRWLPLLGLYSGARINELCQLSVGDVQEEDGIFLLDINDKGEGKRLKNAASRRKLPVHPILLQLGFREYVDSMKGKKGITQLWPALKLKRDGFSQDYGKLFQRFNRKFVTSNPKRVFHSFRHNVADGLKQRGVDGNIIAEILGQSSGSITLSRYGKAYGPKVLLEALKKLEYEIEDELLKLPRLG
jgi:integrase